MSRVTLINSIWAAAILTALVLASCLTGCGPDKVTGPSSNDPGGLVVVGLLSPDDQPNATILVFSNRKPVLDATVTLNGKTCRQDDPEDPTYSADNLDFTPGTAYTLQVESSAGTKTMTVTVPGAVVVLSPKEDTVYKSGDNINVRWQPVAGASAIWASFPLSPRHVVAGNATSVDIPASEAPGGFLPSTIDVIAANGYGQCLYDFLLVAPDMTKEGFYAASSGNVTVKIGG